MKKYFDTESRFCIDQEQLEIIFDELKENSPQEYNYSFNQYLRECTGKNGTLVEIEHYSDLYRFVHYPAEEPGDWLPVDWEDEDWEDYKEFWDY